jgi:hypothetical protein
MQECRPSTGLIAEFAMPNRSMGLPAIALGGALLLAACAQKDSTAGIPLAIVVAEDAVGCKVLEQDVPCAGVADHLLKTLQTPTSKLIILSDRKAGRTDDGVTKIADELRKHGYGKVTVAGFITERL